ncbi:unnamed protein product [Caenorhabditis angaria]|uniref:DM domain-containing protein n=1 Tax=Caenorhabditis angaria TaxID=860376 RepID=A0A9P1IT60_9PELO|nr:unnamed protein product [Caenorhabditis angaria]
MTQIGLYPSALTKPFELSLSAIKSVLEPENPSYSKRVPNCQKCGQHGRKSRLKGHKRVCPFRDCTCAKCSVVSERQKLMADQIKIRRRQRKDTLMNLTREHITSTLNAAAALSATQFNLGNFSNLNALLYGTIKTTPQPLLSSPTSSASDASSYSPSLQFPSPSLPLLLPPSPDSLTPTNTTTSTTNTTTPLVAPVPTQSTSIDRSPIGEVGDEEEMIIGEEEEEVSENLEHEEEEEAEEKLNCIIDVCSV